MLGEAFGEIRRGVESYHVADFDNLVSACGEQFGTFAESDDAYVVVRSLACYSLDAFVEIRTAHVEHSRQTVDIEIGVCEIVENQIVEFFYEFGVFRFLNILGMRLFIEIKRRFYKVFAQAPTAFENTRSLCAQLLYRERLFDIGVGAYVQALDFCFDVGLCRK